MFKSDHNRWELLLLLGCSEKQTKQRVKNSHQSETFLTEIVSAVCNSVHESLLLGSFGSHPAWMPGERDTCKVV